MLGLGLTLMGGLIVPGPTYEETEVYYPAHSVAAPVTTNAPRYFFQRTFGTDTVDSAQINSAANWRVYYRAENIQKVPKRYSYFAAAGFIVRPVQQNITPFIALQMAARYGGTEETYSIVLCTQSNIVYTSGTDNLFISELQVSISNNRATIRDSIGKSKTAVLSSGGYIAEATWKKSPGQTVDIAGLTTSNCEQDFCGSATQNLTLEDWRTFVVPMKSTTGHQALYEANLQSIQGI